MKTRHDVRFEIRYAIRLCQRTSRFYRRAQAVGIFISVIGGSAIFASAAQRLPAAVAIAGSCMLVIAGAGLIAMRPADKAAANEADIRRYQSLLTRLPSMPDDQLEAALEEAHQGDAPEIEPLRNVAYNDMAVEIGQPEYQIQLSLPERTMRLVA